jgi:exopolyphosphatase/guanosine-5'-triphosphate,3'-diphosphate pyrophosphatase
MHRAASSTLSIAKRPVRALASRDLMRLAAIDVGSNSIHMIVAQVDSEGGFTTLWRMKEMVGLGRMSFPSHRLSREAINQAILTLRRFQLAANNRQAEKTIAVATSAVREAENGGDFIERAKRRLGLDIRVVSDREEARLIYMAVRHAADLRNEPALIVDVGGGSVEFIVANQNRALLLESRKLGAARMTAQHVKSDPLNKDERNALLTHYDKELGPLCEQIAALKPTRFIGTSGTLENISALCGQVSNGNGNSAVIARQPLEKLVEELLDSKSADRAKMHGLDEQRKDQITAGALLVRELFRRLHIRRMEMCRFALREGILIDYLARHAPDLRIRTEVPDPRRRSVVRLARRCHWNQVHSEQVARLCTTLFDEMRSLHGLGPVERELIEYGAMLHDIGWHIGSKSHHKHSMYLIRNGELKSFTDEEVEIIAHIARYHRKTPPSRKHDTFASLRPRARKVVEVGASLLRLADGLDRSHANVVQGVKCRFNDDHIRCVVAARSDAQLELWTAKRKRKLFTTTFDREISFELPRR